VKPFVVLAPTPMHRFFSISEQSFSFSGFFTNNEIHADAQPVLSRV
jgi:hypothetical protein